MRHVGIIGCGKIGGPVIKAIQEAQAGNCTLRAVLSRDEHRFNEMETDTDPGVFFSVTMISSSIPEVREACRNTV